MDLGKCLKLLDFDPTKVKYKINHKNLFHLRENNQGNLDYERF